DQGVRADIHSIVLGSSPEDAGVLGQVTLRQGDHHAALAWFGDGQPDGAADGQGAAEPVVLHEALAFFWGRDHDVGAEPPGLEAPLRVQGPQTPERASFKVTSRPKARDRT